MAKYSPPLPILSSICDGRLTLTSGVPVLTGNVTGAGTLYWTPYKGNRVSLFDGSDWVLHTFSELSLALSITSGTLYDVFVYNNSGTLALELAAWTNDTTRATALTRQDGVLVKSGDATRRYLGTLRASGSNTCEFSFAGGAGPRRMFLWNLYHQEPYNAAAQEIAVYTYTTDSWRRANNSDGTKIEWVAGQSSLYLAKQTHFSSGTVATNRYSGIALNGNYSAPIGPSLAIRAATAGATMYGTASGRAAAGYNYAHTVEYATASGTFTWVNPSLELTIWC